MRRVAILALAILAAGCAREDPRKPHQILEEGRAALVAGELATAQSLLELAVARADRAAIDRVSMKSYAVPLFQAYALQGKLPEAERTFDRLNRPQEELFLFVREANNLMALYAQAGRTGEALRVARKLATTLTQAGSNYSTTLHVVAWGNIDRARSAGGETPGAMAAFEEARSQLENLARFREGRHWPLDPGMKTWLARYASHLRATGRAQPASQVEALAARIESGSASAGPEPPCVSVGDPPKLGCLLDVPMRAPAGATPRP